LKATEDQLAVLVLRGHYTTESDPGVFYVSGKPISDDALVNRLRQRAVKNYTSLPGIPDELCGLIRDSQLGLTSALSKYVLIELRRVNRKYKKLELTESGVALLKALAVVGCIAHSRKSFSKCFSGEQDMHLEHAAAFASALVPELKSFPNKNHGDGFETACMLDEIPEIREQGATDEEIGTALDMPFYSPISQLHGITEGLLIQHMPSYFGGFHTYDWTRGVKVLRRLEGLIENGFDISAVPSRHNVGNDLDFLAKKAAAIALFRAGEKLAILAET
jgi:hypothetical protein